MGATRAIASNPLTTEDTDYTDATEPASHSVAFLGVTLYRLWFIF